MDGRTIGILGGGQLGRMMGLVAHRIGLRLAILDPGPSLSYFFFLFLFIIILIISFFFLIILLKEDQLHQLDKFLNYLLKVVFVIQIKYSKLFNFFFNFF